MEKIKDPESVLQLSILFKYHQHKLNIWNWMMSEDIDELEQKWNNVRLLQSDHSLKKFKKFVAEVK